LDVVAVGRELSIRVDGHAFELAIEGDLPAFRVALRGRTIPVRVETERTHSAQDAVRSRGANRETSIRSPMPGRVVKVLVSEGDAVQAGQGLVVLEAMKMENEVRARSAGVVARIWVVAGAAVEGNTPLITLA
jgi:biotin carboxyl carrier protein